MIISGHFHVLGMQKPHFQCNANREVATTSLVFFYLNKGLGFVSFYLNKV